MTNETYLGTPTNALRLVAQAVRNSERYRLERNQALDHLAQLSNMILDVPHRQDPTSHKWLTARQWLLLHRAALKARKLILRSDNLPHLK